METGIPGKIREIQEALSEDDPLCTPWNDHYPGRFPDTDVQLGILTGISGVMDRIADRACTVSDLCRIYTR